MSLLLNYHIKTLLRSSPSILSAASSSRRDRTMSAAAFNNSLSTYVLPKLPDYPLPPLPRISDSYYSRLVVTHSSNHNLPRRPNALELDPEDKVEDYEKLEHVGDALLGAVVTALLHDIYPELKPGPATMLKSHLVSNATLAQICKKYRIPETIIAAPSALYTTRLQVKVRASVFEAYIAGVFYDFLVSEIPGAYGVDGQQLPRPEPSVLAIASEDALAEESIECNMSESESSVEEDDTSSPKDTNEEKTVPPPEPAAIITSRPQPAVVPCPSSLPVATICPSSPVVPPLPTLGPLSTRTRGEAFDYIDSWLRELFLPYAPFALSCMQAEVARLESSPQGSSDEPENEDRAMGATGALNQWSIKETNNMPRYTTFASDGGWKCICVVNDEEGKEWTSESVRLTKRAAMAVCAWKLCKSLELSID